ncbi:MAG: stalk domain-containing protein, partial [Bacilli bacterium]|nr:stalk domain-containing protein [Bacilli bacterium]
AWKDGGYNTISGTSMATPHITGAIALLADKFYLENGRLPTEGEMDNLCPFYSRANGEIFKHIKKVTTDDRLMGMGILDLSINLQSIGCKEGFMWLNSNIAIIDGVEKTMDQALTYDNITNRTLAPVRFVFEEAGFDVEWNQERQEVHFKR